MGFVSGTGFAKLHKKTAEAVGIKDPAEIVQKISSAMFQCAGFGRIEVKMLTPEHFMILVYNSFECEMGRGSVMPYSYFVRGMFAGVLRGLFGKAFAVTETACIGRGDPYCHFEAIARPVMHQKT
ncbi:MAG: V4R domain-containing protein [Candidatus Methanomethylicaceae archaeon]